MKLSRKLIAAGLTLSICLTSASLTGCAAGNAADEKGTDTAEKYDFSYSDRDYDASYDVSNAVKISLADSGIKINGKGASASGSTLCIEKEGTYIVSGTLSDGQIRVETADDEKVQVVLDGVNIACTDNAPILVEDSDKVFITLADGSKNALTGSAAYSESTADDGTDGVVFSRADLCINGGGSLTVSADGGHGIVSKDDLIVTGGEITITASGDGLQGKDCVKIGGGTLSIDAADNGIKSTNDEDEWRGFVSVDGGSLTVAAGDDGIHAFSCLRTAGGQINVTESYEGLEGNTVIINGGTIRVTASDDGINAAGGNDSSAFEGGDRPDEFSADESAYIEINGGKLTVDASGDGIDSNGDLTVTGGTVYLSGPVNDGNGTMDYAGEGTIDGGSVVMAGSSGMAMTFGESSSQCSLFYGFSSAQAAGSEVTIKDSSGSTLLSFSPEKSYTSVIFSSAGMKSGEEYTVCVDGKAVETVTISSVSTSAGNSAKQMGGGPGGGMSNGDAHQEKMPQGGQPGEMPPGEQNF